VSRNFELILRSASCQLERALNDGDSGPFAAAPARPDPCDDEEILPLVRRVFLAAGRAPRSVLFASVEAAGQSARVSARVARALASCDVGTVCLVDANLRSPSMHRMFGVPQDPGVVDRLERGSSSRFLTREVSHRLWLMPAGGSTAGSAADLPPDGIRAMTHELREAFGWVLVDVGPIGTDGVVPAVAPCADGVVLVVAAHATRRAPALQASQDIVAAGGLLLGAVLTDRTFPVPEAIYRRL
jgi:Mrp family chromosome partitioning ATPase